MCGTIGKFTQSVRGTIDLGHIDADEDGSFSSLFAIPSDAAPGSYQLTAAIGDERITSDFTVLQ